jgi:hypothetical protein
VSVVRRLVTKSAPPFASTPGRDVSKDAPPPFDIARFYYDERFRIAEDLPLLRRLIAAVDSRIDLEPHQWAQWSSVALGFAPTLILELGRGHGNSTALFTQAARRLGGAKVVSLCRTGNWASTVAPRIARFVDEQWFRSLDARRIDILAVDYDRILADHPRVLILWDAHGFEIAELVLGELLPRLIGRPHLIVMHDIDDNRYGNLPRSYGGHPLWKGAKQHATTGVADSRVNIGWMNSREDQIVALADFASRNDVEIGSADHEYATFFDEDAGRADEMRRLLGDEFFSTRGRWAFLTLSGKEGPFHAPAVSGWRTAANRSAVVSDELPRLPATIATTPVPWAYALTFAWRPVNDSPPAVPAWIRCRLQATGGPVGLSLLTADERAFVDSQVVSSPVVETVVLSVPDVKAAGRLVIHTWDAPQGARVRVDDLSLIW